MRKQGVVITFDLAQREGDWLKLGVDLQEHICNLFGLGESERQRIYRRRPRKYKQRRNTILLHRQMILMDRLAWLLWWQGKDIRIRLDAEGWERVNQLSKKFAALNREMNR